MMRRSIAYLVPVLFLLAAALAAALAATPAAAHEKATVAITRADCARLVAHVPGPDVAYQPGVDVYGREVAPADLGGAPRIELPETIFIAIEVDLLERFGIPENPPPLDADVPPPLDADVPAPLDADVPAPLDADVPPLFDADAEMGWVVYQDGRFTFNGQPLQDEAQAGLAARCQEIVRQ